MTIPVAVVDENEIFRCGVIACLDEDATFEIVSAWSEPLLGAEAVAVSGEADVAVVSAKAAAQSELTCSLVVCASERFAVSEDGRVLAVLPRNGLTAAQLAAAVNSAAVGLRVSRCEPSLPRLDERCLQILRMLADGATTEEIARSLCYSQRTIKGLVASIQVALCSRTRAQAVAMAIRAELI